MSRLRYSRFLLAEEDEGNLMMAYVRWFQGCQQESTGLWYRDVAHGPLQALRLSRMHQEMVGWLGLVVSCTPTAFLSCLAVLLY